MIDLTSSRSPGGPVTGPNVLSRVRSADPSDELGGRG